MPTPSVGMAPVGWFVLTLVMFGIRIASAAPLASLVPDDAGLCFEVHHLADHVREFRRSDLYGRLAALPPLRAAVGGRVGQLRQLTTKLEKQLGVGTETLWASVIGQEVLLAVWPPAEPGGEGPALFLVRSPKPEMLNEVFNYVVAEQRRAGKLEGEPVAIKLPNQPTRVAAIRAQGKRPTVYLAVFGSLGVVATSLQLVEQVLQNEDAQPGAGSSLAALPAYRAAQGRLEPDAAVRIFLNPRPWQAQFEAGPQPRDARQVLVRDTLLATWKASEYLVASLSFDHELRGEAYLKCDVKSLPEPSRSLVESIRGESTLAERIPRDALLAIAGRLDSKRLVQTLVDLNRSGKFFGAPGKLPPVFGGALALLSGLGPDAGLYLLAPEGSASAAAGWPVRWLVAVGSRPIEADNQQPALVEELVPLVRSSLDFAAQLEAARQPRRLVQVRTEPADAHRGPLTTILGLPKLKADEAISFMVAERTLWVGSDAALVRGAVAAENRVAPPSTRLARPGVLAYFDLAEIRSTLIANPPTTSALGKLLSVEPSEGNRKLAELLALLRLADTLVVAGHADGVGFSGAWRLATGERETGERETGERKTAE